MGMGWLEVPENPGALVTDAAAVASLAQLVSFKVSSGGAEAPVTVVLGIPLMVLVFFPYDICITFPEDEEIYKTVHGTILSSRQTP